MSASGGFNKNTSIELGHTTEAQLFNLKEDIGQTNNVAAENPKKVAEFLADFEAIMGEYSKALK